MARATRSAKLETRTARLKLPTRKKPYSVPVAPNVVLQYRRNKRHGTWSVRLTDGKDEVHRLAGADDHAEADGHAVLDFWQAQEAARAKAKIHQGAVQPVTLEQALATYEADLKARGNNVHNMRRAKLHLSPHLLKATISSLEADQLRRWRNALVGAMVPSSVNRTTACVKAALNLAADHDPRITQRPWRIGLQPLRDSDRSRNVILPDETVRQIVAEAYRDGDAFGRLVEVAALTGARVSQIARLEVQDLQDDLPDVRLMMPASRKGRGGKKVPTRPVPIPLTLARRLRAAVEDRPSTAPLLAKPSGDPWRPSDHTRPFTAVIERLRRAADEEPSSAAASLGKGTTANFDGVTISALRHSSIVRQLLGGVPIRVVAVNHDTSIAMIERTYSRHITDHADALARKTLLEVSAPQHDNVVTLRGGCSARTQPLDGVTDKTRFH
jgi:integrase